MRPIKTLKVFKGRVVQNTAISELCKATGFVSRKTTISIRLKWICKR